MWEKVKSFYQNLSIKKKITIGIIPMMLILSVLILITSNAIFSETIIRETKKNIGNECDLLIGQMENVHDNMITCADILTKDINRIYQSKQMDGSRQSFITVKNQLISAMDYNRRCFPEIHSVIFMDLNNHVIANGMDEELKAGALQAEFQEQIPSTGPPVPVFFSVNTRNSYGKAGQLSMLTMARRVISIDEGFTLGYIFINVEEQTFADMFPGDKDQQDYFVIDDEGMVLISRGKEKIQKPVEDTAVREQLIQGKAVQFQMRTGGRVYLFSKRLIPCFGWALVNQISVEELKKEVNVNTMITLLISGSVLLMTIFLVFQISGMIAWPIMLLRKAVEEVQKGNLDVFCPVDTREEIGTLSQGFNDMLKHIRQLFSQVKEEQRKKGEYKLALSQLQIKPHFLYNALDLIYVLCQLGEPEKAAVTTKALADFYRISLSDGDEIVTLREELDLTRNYLTIQKERYMDMMSFTIEADEKAFDYLIPKITLQPLVENAIYHGLKKKKEGGSIGVSVHLDKGNICIIVKDDGAGMKQEHLQAVFEKRMPGDKGSFGIGNVHERIQLYFGMDYGLSVESEEGKGTICMIRIPCCYVRGTEGEICR